MFALDLERLFSLNQHFRSIWILKLRLINKYRRIHSKIFCGLIYCIEINQTELKYKVDATLIQSTIQSPFSGQLTVNPFFAEFAPDVPCKCAVVTNNFPVDAPSCDP